MSLFSKVRSGQLNKDGFLRTLASYEAERIELRRNEASYGPDLFKSKLRDIDMSISMIQLFIDKFDDIAQGPVKTTDKTNVG